MQQVAQWLIQAIEQALPLLQNISDDAATAKPAPNKWSYKEIIGHLMDSACNNQQKFVRCRMQNGVDFVPYAQDEWVAAQQYNKAGWNELLLEWFYYNRHIAHIIRHADPALLDNKIYIGGNGPYTLGFIMPDYVEHLIHHLNEILPEVTFPHHNYKVG